MWLANIASMIGIYVFTIFIKLKSPKEIKGEKFDFAEKNYVSKFQV